MKKTLILFLLVLWSVSASAHFYIPRFDPNQDGVSDIADVAAVVDCVLNRHSNIEGVNGDVGRDGHIDITDVSLMIDYLFHPENYDLPFYDPAYPEIEIPEGAEVYEANGVSFAMAPIDTVDEDGNLVHKLSMGVTEVTIELWQAVMGNNPALGTSTYPYITPRWPVSHVSWYDCQEFIARLNELTGQQFRLPTNNEWEYAARGGLLFHQYRYAGSDNLDEVGWGLENLMKGYEWYYGGCPVGLKAPNELGLYDMSGNVSEWCSNGPPYPLTAYVVGGDIHVFKSHCTIAGCIAIYRLKDANEGDFHGNNPVYFGLRLAM